MIAQQRNNKANATCKSAQSCLSPRRRRVTLTLILCIRPNPLEAPHIKHKLIANARPAMTTRVGLPQHLRHPEPIDVLPETLGPKYEGLPPSFVREQLRLESHPLVAGLHSARLDRVPTNCPLPERLAVPMNDFVSARAICPTHILAIPSDTIGTAAPSTENQRGSITLFPVHQIVLAANCTTLPELPPSAAATGAGNMSGGATMPVVPLRLPSASTFSILHTFLYNKDARALRTALLPEGWMREGSAGALKRALVVRGVWANACALGVINERAGEENKSIYDVIDEAWADVLAVLRVTTTAP